MEHTSDKVLKALAPYDLKKEGTKGYRCNSPFRHGSNSHAFTLTIHTPEKGAWFDHVANEGGSLYELANRLGIEIPVAQITSTKRTYAGLKDYAESHGIAAETLAAADWHEVEYKGRLALEFSTKTGKRWRFLDGKTPHYISPQAYKRCWYGLNVTTLQRIAQGQPLIIANGEISTVVGQAYGLAAASITGGENGVPPELMTELKVFLGDALPKIFVAADCDDKGRRAAKLAESQFKSAGFEAVAVDMRLSKGGDLADFCMLHEEKNVLGVLTSLPALPDVETEQPTTRRNWVIIHASDLHKLPPVKWIVPGEIPENGTTVLFGASGAGKSFVALDYALRIAQHHPVMYIAGEGEQGYRQRIAAWCQHHNKNEGSLYLCLGAVSFMESDDFEEFLQANVQIKPYIVIIDTLARSMVGADENSTRDMGLFIRTCDTVRNTLNCAVLIIHHTGKVGAYERGNSSLRGAADSMIKLSDEDGVIRVECSKSKDSEPFPTRYKRLLPVKIRLDGKEIESPVLVDADVVMETGERLTLNQQRVLETLTLEVFSEGADLGEIVESTELARGSVQRIISRLMKFGFIAQSAKKEPYRITDSGLDALTRMTRMTQAFLQTSLEPVVRSGESSESSESSAYTTQSFVPEIVQYD